MFRREAVDFQRRRLSGNVVLRPDPPLTAACSVFGILVVALSAAFTFVSLPATMRVTAACTPAGSGYLEVARPRLSAGSVLQRAELETTDGRRAAVWNAGQGTTAGTLIAAVTAERGPSASGRCTVAYHLTARPADAVVHRLLRGS
ncbi:MAG: hypothetical protein QOI11_675 [Candidatus Eremiobacteraeota bacterium]|nr:hypothetical protein [Candidatus Eremiobacteraeota bacterium]